MSDQTVDAESILNEAIRIASVRERMEFIDRVCGADTPLRAQVIRLLDNANATRTLDSETSDSVAVTGNFISSELPTSCVSERIRSAGLPLIAGYEILEVLGRGGMGVVYKARQLNLKRLVALKTILAAQADNEGLSRFRSEAEAAARLQHPNIVQIHEVGDYNGQPYMALEFIDGGTLSEYLSHSLLSNHEAAEIVEMLARAMHYAHSQGIVHRDLKPGNVLLGRLPTSSQRDGNRSHASAASHRSSSQYLAVQTKNHLLPKISDFGLAKQMDAESEFTRTGAVLGTPNYMAPEQAAGEREIGPAADVYSLGAILYALIARQPPFLASNAYETMQMVRKMEPVRLRKLQPKVARDLETICMKCLEKKPANRYASAEALADDLRCFLEGSAIAARPASLAYRATKLAIRRRREVIITSVTLVMLIAGLMAGVWYSSYSHQRTKDVLSDIKLLAELKDQYSGLLAIHYANRREAMESWIDRSNDLLQRLTGHRQMLKALRREGQSIAAQGEPEEHWHFASPAKQLQHDNLQQLVAGTEALHAPSGMIHQVKSWAALAPRPSEIESQWNAASQAIEDSLGIALQPCDGLYALGADSESQLWEFVDLRFGLSARHDENQRLVIGPDTGFVLVLLPGGRFRMGSLDSEPGRKPANIADEQPHDVEVSPFFISKFEITQAQWEKVMGQNPSEHLGPLRAAHDVSWIDCERFCQKTGLSLPSEAQWEYACRATTSGPYNLSAPLEDIGWYRENSFDAVHVVGEKLPNRFGLYDMHGNVLEWCQDVFAADYYLQPEASGLNPLNTGDPMLANQPRVLRGGSFEGVDKYLRSADRYFEKPERRWRGFGVRPMRPINDPN